MSRNYPRVSFCIPVYNEENYLTSGLEIIHKGLTKLIGKDRFEIIIIDNGSNDKTPLLLRKIKRKNVRSCLLRKKGLGLAFRKSLNEAKYEHIIYCGIDLPFGFTDLNNVKPIWSKYDLIFGSKAHAESQINTSIKRKLSSSLYRFLLNSFFHLNVRDPQGSIFLKKSKIKPLLKYCTASNAFYSTQLAIYANKLGLRITEVPVSMNNSGTRPSKFNILSDGFEMLLSLLEEYFRYKKHLSIR